MMEEDEDDIGLSCLTTEGRGAKLRVQTERCSTCIFSPGNLMSLRPGRLKDMTEQVRESEGYVTCHQTLSHERGAVCRGSFDNIKTQTIQVVERLDLIEWVQATDKEGHPS